MQRPCLKRSGCIAIPVATRQELQFAFMRWPRVSHESLDLVQPATFCGDVELRPQAAPGTMDALKTPASVERCDGEFYRRKRRLKPLILAILADSKIRTAFFRPSAFSI